VRVITCDDFVNDAASWIAARATATDPFRVALAGGSTPRGVYECLAELPLDWGRWHVWWGDEREVPPDHPDSNERMAREALLSHVGIPEDQIHPLRDTDVAIPDAFDLVLLGIGGDGHTASLFPGDPGLEATVPIIGVARPDHPRFSLTYPVLSTAQTVAFLVSGEGKREILSRVLAGDMELPAARVSAAEVVVLADSAAAPDS
jgi:6-phosphogluconolactonase